MKKMRNYIVKNKDIFVGLEDSKRTWKLCVRCEKMIIHEISIPAQYHNLRSYLIKNYPGCNIKLIYEAGFRGFNLYDHLTADGIFCVVTPPNKVTQEKNSRVKNDKIDARRLAKVLENGDYKACHVPDKKRREDRQINRTLIQIQKDIVQTRNRIRKFLEFHGLDENFPPGRWTEHHYQMVKQLKLNDSLQFSLNILLDLLDKLIDFKKLTLKKLNEISHQEKYNQTYTIFKSAPGIGELTAIRLVLEWGENLSRFPNAKHFASFTGLTCSEYSTGDNIRYGHITKQSNKYLRASLIQCAWVAYKRDPALLDKFMRVWKNSGSKKKAIVAVARKLAVRLYHCAIEKEEYCLNVSK